MFDTLTHNPDVLSCLANLSSDEVFTPPQVAAQMLDLLPQDLWQAPEARFLDPVSKSGVFLREIAKRLLDGLKDKIPDLQTRVNHILTQQLYGMAPTELTALITRRSLYCSKDATGAYSIATAFPAPEGNIHYERTPHTWRAGKCVFCGASEEVYSRDESLETHAYQFIHTEDPTTLFPRDMKFDVIIGNPPYQLGDGGHGTSASSIYNKFIEQAKKLNPRYLSMIVPARWYSGGKGMDDFRDAMLKDDRLRTIVDFPEAIDCFPGVQIKGGVCYFLWERDNPGKCTVRTSRKGEIVSEMTRPLLEEGCETFIRYNEAISILKKVQKLGEPSMKDRVSSRKPFGFETTFKGKSKPFPNAVKLYQNGGVGYVERDKILVGGGILNYHKAFIPPVGSGSDSFPHSILGRPFIGEPNSACTETYIVAGVSKNKKQIENLIGYLATRFLRFLVLLNKPSQHATSKVYTFVPMQDFNEPWTDEKLYKKYGLTAEEIAFIESMIRPMDLAAPADAG